MNIVELQVGNEMKIPLYVNERKIQVLEIYNNFNICEIVYEDNQKIEIIDIMGISKKPKNHHLISLHRFKGG